jgi:hypothetical protein
MKRPTLWSRQTKSAARKVIRLVAQDRAENRGDYKAVHTPEFLAEVRADH